MEYELTHAEPSYTSKAELELVTVRLPVDGVNVAPVIAVTIDDDDVAAIVAGKVSDAGEAVIVCA